MMEILGLFTLGRQSKGGRQPKEEEADDVLHPRYKYNLLPDGKF